MVEPFEPEKKQEQEKNNFEKKPKAALSIVSQLVRYVPTGGSLWIFGSFIKNQDWLSAIITFPIMVIMVAWSAYSKGFLLQIQERMDLERRKGTESLIQQAQKLDFLNFRIANSNADTADLSGVDLSGVDLSGVDLSGVDLSGVDLSGVDLSGVDLSGVDLSGVDLRYANLRGADLRGADLSGADLRYANLSGADLTGANLNHAEFRYANLRGADLRYVDLTGANLKYANLSYANLNCTLLNGANLSDANLSGALLFFVNLREVLNLEPLQLEAKPSPFLCNAALPSYSKKPNVNPNRACEQIPQLLSARYNISPEEAQWIVDEARQYQWD